MQPFLLLCIFMRISAQADPFWCIFFLFFLSIWVVIDPACKYPVSGCGPLTFADPWKKKSRKVWACGFCLFSAFAPPKVLHAVNPCSFGASVASAFIALISDPCLDLLKTARRLSSDWASALFAALYLLSATATTQRAKGSSRWGLPTGSCCCRSQRDREWEDKGSKYRQRNRVKGGTQRERNKEKEVENRERKRVRGAEREFKMRD